MEVTMISCGVEILITGGVAETEDGLPIATSFFTFLVFMFDVLFFTLYFLLFLKSYAFDWLR